MSDLQDTPDLSEKWCPTCQPERDPSREILQVEYCNVHAVGREGFDDAGVRGEDFFGQHLGTMESEGRANRMMSDLLKKGKKRKKK